MNLDLSHLAEMTAADEARFFTIFDRQLEYDSGEEARSNLLREGANKYPPQRK